MAINQSQSKILRICLFVALLVALADAASLRGSNEIEEVVEDSEEDFYHMIVDEPFETKNEEEEPGFYETYVEPLFTTHDAPEDEVDTGRELWWWQPRRVVQPQQPVFRPPRVAPRPFVRPYQPLNLAPFNGSVGGSVGGGGGTATSLGPRNFMNGPGSYVAAAPRPVSYPSYDAFGQPVAYNGRNVFNQYVSGPYGGARQRNPYQLVNVQPVSFAPPARSTNAQGVEYATGNFAKTPSNGYFDNLSF